ncbi:MAG: fibronectin type III domain-containing protein [Deltaproteobacteria bacterium]|nr:fibronectin type III domain-containing protein [Deltaproteobacteria bacterium]
MGLKEVISLFVAIIIFAFINEQAVANWQEPVEVVKGQWGKSSVEFGYYEGDSMDTLPESFIVIPNGNVVIKDLANNQIKVFTQENVLIKSFVDPGISIFEFDGDKVILSQYHKDIKLLGIGLFNIQTEEWEWSDRKNGIDYNPESRVIIANNKSKFTVQVGIRSGIEYSPEGNVLNKFTDRPLLFGREKKSAISGGGKYNQVIEFEDATYNCNVPDGFDQFKRDNAGYLYGIAHNIGEPSHTRIYKITKCGKIIGTVDFPPRKETFLEDDVRIDEDYGEPVFAQNGDVYTWKRTPTHYSILKWAWVDDPNVNEGPDAPESVQALPSTSGVYLTWNPSPQDPGCVNGYEIERATSATGVFSNVTTVPLDEKQTYSFNDTSATAGATWYYRISAKSDIGNSDPVEVSATRP